MSNAVAGQKTASRATSLTQTIKDKTTKPTENLTDSERLNAAPVGKPPVVRRGQKQAYTKASLDEQDERIIFCRDLIVRRKGRAECHKLFRAKFGNVWQTCERYMRRARLEIAVLSNKSSKQAKDEAVGYYESVIASDTSSEVAKLRAQENLDKLFGNATPSRLNVGDPTGKPLVPPVAKPTVQFVIVDNGRDPSVARPAQIAEHVQEADGGGNGRAG